jgi:hypothetical protein
LQNGLLPQTSAVDTQDATDLQNQIAQAVSEKNVKIDFWGRVVDENNDPIPGVKITFRVREWLYLAGTGLASRFPRQDVLSDNDGNFRVVGENGDVLTLESVHKSGYRLSLKSDLAFSYGESPEPFHPDASNPVLIRMWKEMPAGGLVSLRKLYGFVPDGRPYALDLVSGQKQEGQTVSGDLLVKVTRPKSIESRQQYEWSLELSVPSGGLVETEDESGFLAPESGYQQSVVVRRFPGEETWTEYLAKDYFISSRNGTVFGFLHLRIRPNYNGESAIFIEGRLNPSGSRNLQP